LNVLPNTPLAEDLVKGIFTQISPWDMIREERDIISLINTSTTSAMKNDHISNYVNIESENIGRDKHQILQILNETLKNKGRGDIQPKYRPHL